MSKSKKWIVSFLCIFITFLLLTGCFMIVLDPYFHFHKPLPGMYYVLDNERYQNDGIVKQFDYDAIITGSSMTECFKTSELDELFGVNSIKVPYSGGSYKEVNDNLRVATEHNENIKMIVRCLDANRFFDDKDDLDYSDYPTYLYDDNPFNDVNYLFNVSICLVALQNLLTSFTDRPSTSFDAYCNWSNDFSFGKEAVDARYARDTVVKAEEMLPITEDDYLKIHDNIEQNVLSLARENPEIQFYIYISPYSIYYMDYWCLLGELERQLAAEKYVIELLLTQENIHVFSFYTEYDTIENLDNYKDVAHHSGALHSQILQWLHEGKDELTSENYEAYCEEVWDHYMNYDYDLLFQQ
ncbi:MAG: hypothetical protein NC432_01490 [Roseburia sp.]|nr:hypothetical protein [Roseburia sp.]MCM1096714.1 hypothetical protein [Ruminococcus flavefaciens]